MKSLFFILMFVSTVVFAQNDKIETEKRVKTNDVPFQSIQWLQNTFPHVSKVKWYSETTSGQKSFEAKFKDNKKNYSVEFSENGEIEDVEIAAKLESIDDIYRINLQATFDTFEKFKIKKIQEQWSSDSSEQLTQAILKNHPDLIAIKYEVEFMAIIDQSYGLWEGLFDQTGKLISIREVKLRATDNLDY